VEVKWWCNGGKLATLNVKKFPDPLYRELKRRARSEGRSLAREVTILLQEQLTVPKKYKIGDWPKLAGGLWKGNEIEKFLEEGRRW
jgi:plasmid stability protein